MQINWIEVAAALGSVFLWAIIQLVQCKRACAKLQKIGEAEQSETNQISKSRIPAVQRALRVLAKLSSTTAAMESAGVEHFAARFYNPERDLRQLMSDLFGYLARARALAGLLIIAGLLTTLINLRTAVESMKNAMQPGSETIVKPQGAGPPPPSKVITTKVGSGIEGIASAAGAAFSYSAIAISFAAIIILSSVPLQRSANKSGAAFADYVYERLEATSKREIRQSQDAASKLAAAADVLAQVALQFDKTNTGLADLKGFGEKLDAAAQQISTSVAALPAQLDNSMAKISGDVAEGIHRGLQHQGEYLKSLVAIYSEHATTLKKVVEFLSQVTNDHKAASAALVGLASLPKDIQAVSRSGAESATAASELKNSVASLSSKVAKLPAEELKQAAHDLTEGANRVAALEAEIAALLQNAETAFSSLIQRETREQGAQILTAITRMGDEVRSFVSVSGKENAEAAQKIADSLHTVKIALERLGSSGGAGGNREIRALEAKMEMLSRQIEGLLWPKLRNLFRFQKKGTGT